jgi:hypothetical protein
LISKLRRQFRRFLAIIYSKLFTNAVIFPRNRSQELVRIAIFSALFSLPALPVAALTLQQSFSNSYSQTSFGLGTVVVHPPLTSFSVQPFDASLGTLNTATIEWNTGAIGTVGGLDRHRWRVAGI